MQSLTSRDREVMLSVNGGREPHWSRDGTELYFRSTDSMYVAQRTTAPSISVVSRQALFAIWPCSGDPSRPVYDVLPGNRGLLMLARVVGVNAEKPRIVVRTNALAPLKGSTGR